MRLRKATSEWALILPDASPNRSGRSRVLRVSLVTIPKPPPPPPLRAQNRSGSLPALAIRTEPSALDEPRDANGQAATALHVAARPGGHGVVDAHPDRARPDGHRGLRGEPPIAAVGDERRVEVDAVHRSRPDQQRIGR